MLPCSIRARIDLPLTLRLLPLRLCPRCLTDSARPRHRRQRPGPAPPPAAVPAASVPHVGCPCLGCHALDFGPANIDASWLAQRAHLPLFSALTQHFRSRHLLFRCGWHCCLGGGLRCWRLVHAHQSPGQLHLRMGGPARCGFLGCAALEHRWAPHAPFRRR